jgi:predicted PurR-regulated permease PerM
VTIDRSDNPTDKLRLATTRIVIGAGSLVAVVWLAAAASPLFGVLLISALLAYVLYPLVRLLERRTRLSHTQSTWLVYVLFLLILAGIPAGIGAIAAGQFRRFQADLGAALDALREWISRPITVLGYSLHPQTLVDNLEQTLDGALAALPGGSFDILSSVTTNLLWGTVILISLYYFLQDGPLIKPWLAGLTSATYQPEIRRLLDEIDRVWGVFLRVQLLLFVILSVLIIGGSWLVIWLFQSGFLGVSPLVFVLLLVLVFAGAQQVDNLWLRPQWMGKELRLHSGLVYVGLASALALSGPLAALIVVPCMATVKVVGRYVWCKMMGCDPWPETPLPVTDEQPTNIAQEPTSERS